MSVVLTDEAWLACLDAERAKVKTLESANRALRDGWDLELQRSDNVACGGAWDAGVAEVRVERLVRAATIALAHIQTIPADWGATRAWELLHDALVST